MFNMLQLKISTLIEGNTDYSIHVQEYDDEEDTPFILALVTPLMKRVHTMVSGNFNSFMF